MDAATDFGAVDSIVTKEYVEMERPEISTKRGATKVIADALVNCHGKNAHQLFIQTYYAIATNPWNEKQAIQFLSAMQCKGNDSLFAFKNCEADANDPCEKADYYLLTVGRVAVNSSSDRCMAACATTLCAFLRNCEDAPLHTSTLYLIVSFLLDKAASQTWSDQTTRSLALATHCLLSSNHWSSWDALDTLLQGPSFSLASPSFSAFLNHTLSFPDLSDTYRSQLFARLLLPFIHHPTSTKALKPSFSSLWNAIRCLIQCVSPSIASPFFSLWVESCSACVQSALLPPDELESIVLFVVHRCSSSTLPYLVTNRCYKLLLLAAQSLVHNSTPSVSSPLVGFALQSLLNPDLNPHLQLLLVTLLSSLQPHMTPEEMEATSKVLCHHLSIVLKNDLEKNAEASHDESFRLLSACHPSLPTLILFLIAPLYSLFDSLLSLPPIASIVQESLQRETDLLSLFNQHPIIDSLLPRLLPCCSSSFLHSLYDSIQSRSEEEHSRTPLLRVLLGMPQFTSLHSTLLNTLLHLPSTPEAITQWTLFSRILITTRQQALIQPHIQAWLQLDDPLSLDGSLSPQLQLLTALPFSFLQETLVACSMKIHDSKEVYCVLRLLRVINAVSFQRHKEQGKQHEASEEMNPLKMERLLNVRVLICMDCRCSTAKRASSPAIGPSWSACFVRR